MTIAALYDCSLQLTGEGRRLNEIKIQAPIPRPMGTIMCIGKNYLDHVKEQRHLEICTWHIYSRSPKGWIFCTLILAAVVVSSDISVSWDKFGFSICY
jgi:2-keto-4-pentenoate hydratase/2-oxohepta-3-ene-1,7-dioic acid hydratase in catechol pathway